FPQNTSARYLRGRIYMSLREISASRKDFESIRDDDVSAERDKKNAVAYLDRLDQAVMNRKEEKKKR
ncbi:MAG: hypothetical protein KDB07_09845, partial [Planctomycetes bacterium]|nr:hypothetical protein [Planctomycetota bacterium]